MRPSLAAAGEAAIQLLLDERRHVDPVHPQAGALAQPRGIDVHPDDLHSAHHHVREVALDEPRATKVALQELLALGHTVSIGGTADVSSGHEPVTSTTLDDQRPCSIMYLDGYVPIWLR